MRSMDNTAITVSIHRTVEPEHISEVTAWVQTGVNLANKYPGFLGSGWVRAGTDSTDWHMLYRFSNADTLSAWENSHERQWWLSTGKGIVHEESVERRTGIEGWFDPPDETQVSTVKPSPPPRWKQALSIWIGFFPTNLTFTLLVTLLPWWEPIPLWLRVLITVSILTPTMVYLVLPFVTKRLHRWL